MFGLAKIDLDIKQSIFDAARELAFKNGLQYVSIRNIAKKLGISIGTIYNYYPNKSAILFDIIEDFWKTVFRDFHKVMAEEADFFKQIEALYFHLKNHLKIFRSDWLSQMSALRSEEKSEGKLREQDYMKRMTEVFNALLETHRNEFDQHKIKDLEFHKVADFIFNYFMVMLRRDEPDYYFFDLILKRILL